jgi:hypothetical protein
MSTDEMLRLACIYAEQDRDAFVDAYGKDIKQPVVREAIVFLSQLRAYRKKRWGKTKMEGLMETLVEKPLEEVIKDSASTCT